jgi:hypothetical protein
MDYSCWHVLYSLGAGILAGVAFPLRAYGLTITNEPVFFAAVLPYASIEHRNQNIVWHPESFDAFRGITVLRGIGRAVEPDGSPCRYHRSCRRSFATTPLWNLLIAYLFLRASEKLNARTALGTVAVIGGTIAITLGK